MLSVNHGIYAQGNTEENQKKEITIESDSISIEYDQNTKTGVTKAHGHVVVDSNDSSKLTADKVEVLSSQTLSQLSALGNVKLISPKGSLATEKLTLNKSTVDNIENFEAIGRSTSIIKEYDAKIISTNPRGKKDMSYIESYDVYAEGLATGMQSKMHVKGEKMVKEQETYTFNRTQMSSCDILCPSIFTPWKISSSTVILNKTKQLVTLKNAFFKIYGVPILYVPYYKKSLEPKMIQVLPPSVELLSSQTGFKPRIIGNFKTPTSTTNVQLVPTIYGNFRTDPINLIRNFLASVPPTNNIISPNTTQTKTIADKSTIRNHTLGLVASHSSRQFNLELEAKYTQDFKPVYSSATNSTTLTDSRKNRYYAKINTTYEYNPETILGFKGWNISDPFFGRKYGGFEYVNYLKSNASIVHSNQSDSLFTIKTADYNHVVSLVDDNELPQVLPAIGYKVNKKNASFTTSYIAVSRSQGTQYNKITQNATIKSDQYKTSYGQVSDLKISADYDIYDMKNQEYSNSQTSQYHTRLVPNFDFKTSLPMIKSTSEHTLLLEPKMVAFYTPYRNQIYKTQDTTQDGTINYTLKDIYNLDSTAGFTNALNLFSRSRFSGTDVIDDGLRLAYGINITSKHKRKNQSINFSLGQRKNMMQTVDNINENSLDEYIGGFSFSNKNITFISSINANWKERSLNLMSNYIRFSLVENVTFGFNTLTGNANHLTQAGIKNDIRDISPFFTININSKYTITTSARNSLVTDTTANTKKRKWTSIYSSLTYSNNCILLGLSASVNNLIIQNSGQPKAQFGLVFELKGF